MTSFSETDTVDINIYLQAFGGIRLLQDCHEPSSSHNPQWTSVKAVVSVICVWRYFLTMAAEKATAGILAKYKLNKLREKPPSQS